MEANELRIGNLLNIGEEINKLELVDFVDIYEHKTLFHYQPIPLTDEWLIKFGFENIDTNENGGDNYWYLDRNDFMLDRNLQNLQMKTGFDLKYVHQLQNLYFVLTGEEL
jgi:hypothetical protein